MTRTSASATSGKSCALNWQASGRSHTPRHPYKPGHASGKAEPISAMPQGTSSLTYGRRRSRSEEVRHQQLAFRGSERRDAFVLAVGYHGLVQPAVRVAVDDEAAPVQVQHPVIGDLGTGVKGCLRGEVKMERRIGDFDRQGKAGGRRLFPPEFAGRRFEDVDVRGEPRRWGLR